jgi:hypothetical protein
MDMQQWALIAGMFSTSIFTISQIPMLLRAFRTRDLRSYSAANLGLANVGNAIHWIYVLNLPFGPIWFLHSFHTLVTATMAFWYVRYQLRWSAAQTCQLPVRVLRWRGDPGGGGSNRPVWRQRGE